MVTTHSKQCQKYQTIIFFWKDATLKAWSDDKTSFETVVASYKIGDCCFMDFHFIEIKSGELYADFNDNDPNNSYNQNSYFVRQPDNTIDIICLHNLLQC